MFKSLDGFLRRAQILHAILGSVIELQGWVLRRCLSSINRVCGRPYRPKDMHVRKLCELAGVVWPDPPKKSRENMEDESDDEEEWESEEETDDDEMEVG